MNALAYQDEPAPLVLLDSPLFTVTADQWTRFVDAMKTAPSSAVSEANALGAFEMKPIRLGDLGLVHRLTHTKSAKSGKTIWKGAFVAPHTSDSFLKNIRFQYRVFAKSMTDYASKISVGEIQLQAGMTLSGALAVCHRAGLAGLRGARKPKTQELFERVNGIF